MKKYKIAVLDNHKDVLRVVVEMLLREGFDAEGYEEAEKLLAEAFDACLPPHEPPDLVLVDIRLKPRKMQGMALVAELAARHNVDPAIIVMSGNFTSADLVEAIKLGAAVLPKPFDRPSLIATVERLAGTARRRRIFRAQENILASKPDSSRLHRPVFLSYSSKDDAVANGLRRQIEAQGIPVWYAPTTIAPGDRWKPVLEAAIGEARIFVALLTDNYILASRQCVEELTRFEDRILRGNQPMPLILPVLYELSNKAKRSDLYRQILDRYQCVDISTRRFTDGLTTLLLRIEGVLGQVPPGSQRNRLRDSDVIPSKDAVLSLPPHSEKSFF